MKKIIIYLALASASLITLTSCNATSVDSINFTINDTKYEVEPLSSIEKSNILKPPMVYYMKYKEKCP